MKRVRDTTAASDHVYGPASLDINQNQKEENSIAHTDLSILSTLNLEDFDPVKQQPSQRTATKPKPASFATTSYTHYCVIES